MRRISEVNLNEWFNQFNQQYFGGGLSNWQLVVGDPPDPDYINVYGYCDPETKTIYVTELSLSDELRAKYTLIHEMVHARVGIIHGKKFMSELTRLRNEGAPIDDGEFKEGLQINADYVRGSIDDALLEGVTLEQAQTHVGTSIGLSREGLKRRFPSASKGSGSIDQLRKRLYLFPYDRYHSTKIATTLRSQGRTYREIGVELSKQGYRTMRGRPYSAGAVWHLLNE